MKKLIILFLFLNYSLFAQQNWVALPSQLEQNISNNSSVIIHTDSTATLGSIFQWNSPLSFFNSNHLARFVWVLPPALNGTTANVHLSINGITDSNAIIIKDTAFITAEFPINTIIPPYSFVGFRLTGLKVTNYALNNQTATHWIDFISSPSETSILDNYSSILFSTFKPAPSIPVVNSLLDNHDELVFYPNPTKGTLNVHIKSSNESTFQFNIYNLDGSLLKKYKIEVQKGFTSYQMYVGDVTSGFYIIKALKNNILVETLKFKFN